MKDDLDARRCRHGRDPNRGVRRAGAWPRWMLAAMLAAISGPAAAQDAEVLAVENIVQVARTGGAAWSPASVGQALAIRDRVRTRQRSRATVRLSDLYSMRLDQFTTIEITPAITGAQKPRLDVMRGVTFIFSRAEEGEIDIRTPTANAALRGTQLVVEVGDAGRTMVTVLEGVVDLSNEKGQLALKAGESGEVAPGQAPRRAAALEAKTILQWTLYYPAVLDPGELGEGILEARGLRGSVDAYASGDLLGALEQYPLYSPRSRSARLYKAGVYLAVGRTGEAEAILKGVPRGNRARRALERTIAAVQGRAQEPWRLEDLETATEALAESYYRQSTFDLPGARLAAELATRISPANGYAWTRQAEVEFSFGHNQECKRLLDKAIRLSPRNAQAHAVLGFVLASENRLDEALASFNTAIDLDCSLGNGWLGRGLVRIRRGDLAGGRADIQIAATVEPTVSIFHSYLGKAFGEEGRHDLAEKDLALARRLDPNDPTPWLYSAIERQRTYRPNEAIADLEESIRINDNRRVYRSKFLLDQDRAVRGANLASIYQYAGMNAVAVREASRAVESDYTNASAHLFLANSFDALRDPNRVSLRYETPWFNELFLSNLFSPVGGGPLSQFVSQQEYSKFFAQDGIGGSILGEWRSDPEMRNVASIYGSHGNVSWGFDFEFRDDDGDRSNGDSELFETYAQLKLQVTPSDILYFLGKWQDQESGDNIQRYDNRVLNPNLDFAEDQGPGLALAGWNHQWSQGSNTLFLGGRLAAKQRLRNPMTSQLLIQRENDGLRPGFITAGPGGDMFTDLPADSVSLDLGPSGLHLVYSDELLRAIAPFLGSGDVEKIVLAPFDFETSRDIEIYTAEVQHIMQTERNTLLLGGRIQQGEITSQARLNAIGFSGGFSSPAADQNVTWDTERLSLYAYDYWNVHPDLTLIGGLAWDRVEHPENFRNPPLDAGTKTDEKLSGKAGFTYAPSRGFALRGVYA
ncbi:MAG: tetratricopeptide repeat protein, partial [Akkermansiaceae bacterium]|nr:tetratricopeptide repeat protein [Akkermansiaceae bacterium]